MKINAVKEGYYQIWDNENEILLDQKNSEVEAIQGLINYELEGKSVTMVPPTYRVDIEKALIEEEIIYVEGYVHLTAVDGTQYLRIGPLRDIIRIGGAIKARPKQGKFIIKRTGSTDIIDTYEMYGEQPFEIDNKHEILNHETGAIRVWATESWKIQYFINDVLSPISDAEDLPLDQYNAGFEDPLWRHTRTINATYGDNIKIIGHNSAGEIDTYEFNIETLHSLDQSARIKVLNEEILSIMQEPETA